MENSKKEKLESELKKLESEFDVKYNEYVDNRRHILDEIRIIEAEAAKDIVNETYYEKLVHVTSKCSDGRVEHSIGVIDQYTVDEGSFKFKGGVTHILEENGKAYWAGYEDCGLLTVKGDTNELFRSGKTSYSDINPKFHHDVEIRCTTKEDEEEFVNSAYNKRLLACSDVIKLESEKSISAMNVNV